jgi:hypothetical protein
METKKKKGITDEDLARGLAALTTSVAALTEEVREGFGDVAEMMKEVGDRFDRVDREIRETREVLAHAVEDLAGKLAAYAETHRADYTRLQGRLEELEERVAAIESGKRARRAA